MRPSGRDADEMRTVSFTPDFTRHAEGSVLAQFGDTKVLYRVQKRDASLETALHFFDGGLYLAP